MLPELAFAARWVSRQRSELAPNFNAHLMISRHIFARLAVVAIRQVDPKGWAWNRLGFRELYMKHILMTALGVRASGTVHSRVTAVFLTRLGTSRFLGHGRLQGISRVKKAEAARNFWVYSYRSIMPCCKLVTHPEL